MYVVVVCGMVIFNAHFMWTEQRNKFVCSSALKSWVYVLKEVMFQFALWYETCRNVIICLRIAFCIQSTNVMFFHHLALNQMNVLPSPPPCPLLYPYALHTHSWSSSHCCTLKISPSLFCASEFQWRKKIPASLTCLMLLFIYTLQSQMARKVLSTHLCHSMISDNTWWLEIRMITTLF